MALNESENDFIDGSTNIVSSSKSCSSYKYTKEDIDNLFASDNGQEVEHSLEDNICRP